MGYDPTNKILSNDYPTANTGIGIGDIATCLGLVSQDLGTLCSSDAVNLWAKYRPLAYGGTAGADIRGQLTEAQRLALCYGWTPKQVNTLKGLIDAYQNTDDLNGWTAQLPTGQPTAWYRIPDFHKYYHGAEQPVKKFSGTSIAYQNASGAKVQATCITPPLPGVLDGQSFTLLDMAAALANDDNTYFGLAMFKGTDLTSQSNVEWAYVINANPIGTSTSVGAIQNTSASMSLGSTWSAHTGEWTCIPFLFAPTTQHGLPIHNPWTSWSGAADLMSGSIYTIPMLRPFICTILTSGGGGGGGTLHKAFKVERDYDATAFDYELQLVNQASSAASVAVDLYFCYGNLGSPATRQLLSDEYHLSLGTISVASGASVTRTGSYTPQGAYAHLWDDGVVWLRIVSAGITEWTRYYVPKIQPED